jgi:hypothetical protein
MAADHCPCADVPQRSVTLAIQAAISGATAQEQHNREDDHDEYESAETYIHGRRLPTLAAN